MAYKGLCVAILLSFYEHTALSDYEVANAQTNWNVQSPPCTLATPAISYDTNGFYINERLSKEQSESLTVGYVSIQAAFENKGCIKHGGSFGKNHDVLSDPGACFSACNTQLFGIHKQECYCFRESLSGKADNYTECNESCDSPKNTLCGGKTGGGNDRKFISVYTRVSLEANTTEEANNCRSYKANGQEFFWIKCSSTHYGLCEANGHITLERGEHFGINWKNYAQNCYTKHKYPVSESSVRRLKPDVLPILNKWIGQIKSWIIVELKDSSFEAPFRYGHISRDGGRIQLIFTSVKPSGRFLCLKGTVATTSTAETITTSPKAETVQTTTETDTVPTTSTAETTSTSPKTDTVQITTETDTVPTTSTTYTSGDSVTASNIREKNRGNGGLTRATAGQPPRKVAAYVVVPIGIITIAIVVVFVIRNRRKRTDSTDSQYSDNNWYAKQPPSNRKTAVSNAAYDSGATHKPLDPDDQPHDYFVLEAPSEYATIKEEGIANSGEADYDTTDTMNDWKHAAPGDGNVYNTLDRQVEDTYNHTDNGGGYKIEGGENNTEDTYNHVVEDDGYSTSAQSHQQHVDDTYNILTLKK